MSTPSTSKRTKLARQIEKYEEERRRLSAQLLDVGYIWHGSVTRRRQTCGQPSCRCHKDSDARHGPYSYWTTKVRGKTVSRLLTPAEADLYEEWIKNRRHIEQTVQALKKLSEKVAPLILESHDRGRKDEDEASARARRDAAT